MASDKRGHLCQPKRMSLEVCRGTCRRTTGKACKLVLVHREPLLVPVVELEEPRKMVFPVVEKGETEGQGGAEEGLEDKNNSRTGSGMV